VSNLLKLLRLHIIAWLKLKNMHSRALHVCLVYVTRQVIGNMTGHAQNVLWPLCLDGLQGMRDMSPAPGATAQEGKTAGELPGPDPPLPCIFAFHPPHTRLIPSTFFAFMGCTASAQDNLATGAFHKHCKAVTNRMRFCNTLHHQMKLHREACWTPIIPRCICLISVLCYCRQAQEGTAQLEKHPKPGHHCTAGVYGSPSWLYTLSAQHRHSHSAANEDSLGACECY